MSEEIKDVEVKEETQEEEVYTKEEFEKKLQAESDRRVTEAIKKREQALKEEMKAEIEARDKQDMNREVSPLKKADDAIELDTSNMSLEEVVAHVMDLVEKKLEE